MPLCNCSLVLFVIYFFLLKGLNFFIKCGDTEGSSIQVAQVHLTLFPLFFIEKMSGIWTKY